MIQFRISVEAAGLRRGERVATGVFAANEGYGILIAGIRNPVADGMEAIR